MPDMKFEGLTDFQKDLLDVATNKLPRQTFKFLRKSGTEARKVVVKHARLKVKKNTGNYLKRFKRGKAFKDQEGKYVIRVYNSAPHAHLIEYGHRQVTKDGREVGFTPGKNVVAEGIQKFEDDFEEQVSDWLDELLESGDL